MAREEHPERKPQEHPSEAEFGRGAPGNAHYGVTLSQTPDVNPPEENIPSPVEADKSKAQVEALKEQEAESGVQTTDGYGLTESGELNNVAVEPEMYVEEERKQ